MILNRNSQIVATEPPKPVQYAISALQRDKKAVFTETGMPGGDIVLARIVTFRWSVSACRCMRTD